MALKKRETQICVVRHTSGKVFQYLGVHVAVIKIGVTCFKKSKEKS